MRIVSFGVFTADLRSGELRKNGVKVRLERQPFEVLAILLEHPQELVSREELRKRVWPGDTFVDFDHALNTAVTKIRLAVGDDAANPRFVETVPRRGYRFIAPLQGDAAAVLPTRKWLGLVALLVLGAIAWGVYSYLVPKSAPFQRIEITQVTGNGKVKTAAISPDGRYLGYVVDEGSANPFFGLSAGGKESLWVRQAAGGNDVQVAPAADVDYKQLTFSRDGAFLYATRSERGNGTGSLYKIPLLGGTEKQLIADLDDVLTFSPDGKKMAFVRFLEGGPQQFSDGKRGWQRREDTRRL